MGERVVCALLAAAACVAGLALAASPAAAAGDTYFASPTGTGLACSKGAPCELSNAVAKAGDGDAVLLVPGTYALPFAGLEVVNEISIGSTTPGSPAILQTKPLADVHVTATADPTLHDMRLQGGGGLRLDSGRAERIFVAYVGVLANACELGKGTTLANSVCWTLEVGEEEEGTSHAIEITSGSENQDETVVLRNVTAIADNASGDAIHAFAGSGAELTVDAANVIARSVNGTDIVAEVGEGVGTKSHVNVSNSSFATFSDLAPSPEATVTRPGTNGNVAAAPTFVDASLGDFHLGGDSPTLDGGLTDLPVGIVDLEGHDRAQSKCFGAQSIPDMGAYERTPTAACPPPPPPPPPSVAPRKPVFRVISLLLNKKTGGGRVLVEVPGSGTLSLTGSGVKLVRRTAPAAGGVISLPIQLWAITRVRLAKAGKTKVRLKVTFEGRANGFEQWAKAVVLRKKQS